jgi:murein DD-endopeptidase MepM/ murein hydrolase activator NlpD
MRTDRYLPHQPPFLLYALLGLSLILNIYLVLDRGDALETTSGTAALPLQAAMVPSMAMKAVNTPATTTAKVSTAPLVVQSGPRTVRKAVNLGGGWKTVDTEVSHSLARTFSRAVGEHSGELAAIYSRIFMWEMDLRKDVLRGDRVQVLYREGADGKLEIAAATYDSKKLGKTLTAYLYKKPGDDFASYWTEDGKEVPRRLKASPVAQYQQITALLGDGRGHSGMDFKAPIGTPVTSPKAGIVTRVNWNSRPNGNCVEVRFADGTIAKFLHLSEAKVRANQHVRAGELIATSGNTGRSTAPHLHYQLDRGKRNLDPLSYHGSRQRELTTGAMQGFSGERGRLNAMLGDASLLAN